MESAIADNGEHAARAPSITRGISSQQQFLTEVGSIRCSVGNTGSFQGSHCHQSQQQQQQQQSEHMQHGGNESTSTSVCLGTPGVSVVPGNETTGGNKWTSEIRRMAVDCYRQYKEEKRAVQQAGWWVDPRHGSMFKHRDGFLRLGRLLVEGGGGSRGGRQGGSRAQKQQQQLKQEQQAILKARVRATEGEADEVQGGGGVAFHKYSESKGGSAMLHDMANTEKAGATASAVEGTAAAVGASNTGPVAVPNGRIGASLQGRQDIRVYTYPMRGSRAGCGDSAYHSSSSSCCDDEDCGWDVHQPQEGGGEQAGRLRGRGCADVRAEAAGLGCEGRTGGGKQQQQPHSSRGGVSDVGDGTSNVGDGASDEEDGCLSDPEPGSGGSQDDISSSTTSCWSSPPSSVRWPPLIEATASAGAAAAAGVVHGKCGPVSTGGGKGDTAAAGGSALLVWGLL